MLKTVSSITNAIGALNYKGTWDANANSPALASGVGTKGDYYVVGTAGTTTLNGISNWGVGDWAAFNGSVWQRVEGGADLNGVNLSVSGTSTLSALTASTALALDASKNVVSVTNTGTGNNVLATSPTIATPIFSTTSTTKLDNATTFPVIKASNRAGSGAVHTIGAVLFDGYRDVADPSYIGGMWLQSADPFYQDLSVMYFGCQNTGGTGLPTAAIAMNNNATGKGFYPVADNAMPLGLGGNRWSVVYAGNGTINTSDANEKTDISDLDDAEKRVAVRLKSLFKKFRFKDAVASKGDDARIHVGAIAQEVAAAFVAEGLDPNRYGVFCSDTFRTFNGLTVQVDKDNNYVETHVELNGVKIEVPAGEELPEGAEAVVVKHPTEEKTRLGLRYDQLFAFIIATL
jgi:hypothetical protein